MRQRSLLSSAASALDVAFQAKVLTLGGAEYFQIQAQLGHSTSGLILVVVLLW
jgi:hypothetical protein